MVCIRFRGPISPDGGTTEFVVQTDGQVSVREVFHELLRSVPQLASVWSHPDDIERDALVMRNDTDIALLDGLDTLVSNDDVIVVLPLIHGG